MNRKPGRFILLGSASPDLIRDSSESLAGRIAYSELNRNIELDVKTVINYLHFFEAELLFSCQWTNFFSTRWLSSG